MTIVKVKPRKLSTPATEFPSIADAFFSDFLNYGARNSSPAVNVIEKEESFVLELAVPGLEREDITLDLDDNVLSIRSERKEENENGYTRREFSYDGFEKRFNLPESVDQENIQAKYEHGILRVSLPKAEKALRRTIEIS